MGKRKYIEKMQAMLAESNARLAELRENDYRGQVDNQLKIISQVRMLEKKRGRLFASLYKETQANGIVLEIRMNELR